MKKISQNAKIPVRVGSNKMVPKIQDKKGDFKASMNQIQKLSEQIDLQIQMNEQKHRRIQQQNQNNLHTQEQEDDNEMQNEQNYEIGSQISVLDRAVQVSVQQYFGFNLDTLFQWNNKSSEKEQMNKQEVRFVDIQQYEEYKKIRQFNCAFKQIVQKIQKLRRLSALAKFSGQQKQVKLQNQSDVISLLQRVFKVVGNMSSKNREESNFCCDDSLMLETIQKIQQIEEAVETKLQSLQDDISFKRRVIEELRTNQKTIRDDIQLLESRNYKLEKQLQSIQSKTKYNHSSEEEDNQPQSTEQTEKLPSLQPQKTSIEEQAQTDYHKEYQELMQQYQLYDPLTNIIQQPFPKNKTEAMMLLNKIEAKIQKIEMQKVLQNLP